MKTVLTVKELCERWGVDARTIARYEEDGIIRRLTGMPGVRFSLISIEKIECDGTDNLIMKKNREIAELKEQNLDYKSKLERIKGLAAI